ncbi:MAG: lysophospholipid acyltransferase family protein [Deltaproteobacteria bacterium]|nr:lysophospholipid acyltransferase family protein [Deltaproteobacteria bacterium]
MPPRRKRKRSRLAQFRYASRYRVGEYAVRGFIAVSPLIPYGLLLRFTNLFAWVAFGVLRTYRTRMEENLVAALGEEIRAPNERKALVWRAWKNFARGVLDTTAVMHFSREKILATVAVEGEEHLERALGKGRGVLALSAHLGSFTMIGARLAAGGFPFSVVVKQPRDRRFARLIDAYRAQLGIHTISAKPRREAVRGILKALRQNKIVLVIADEFKSGDVMVDFLGGRYPAPRGPATLALRTGAVTLPMFATRRADDSLVLTIGNAIEPVERPELEDSVTATTAVYTSCLEAAIRRYPDQWNWLGLPRDGKVSRAEMARRKAAPHGASKRGRGSAQAKSPSESAAAHNKEVF